MITDAQVDKFLNKKLAGGAYGTVRTGKQIEEDFKIIHGLKLQGYTFGEITDYLNDLRPYITTENANTKLYYSKLSSIELLADNEEDVKLHKQAMVDMYDWIIRQAIAAWRKCEESADIIERSGYVNNKINVPDGEDDYEAALDQAAKKADQGHPMSSILTKEFLRITTNPRNTEGARFLDIIKNSLKEKAKLLGLVSERVHVDINQVLNTIILNDASANENVKAITSELQAIKAFDHNPLLQIEDDDLDDGDDEDFLNVTYE